MKSELQAAWDGFSAAQNAALMVAVIIPYYQVEPGILGRALRSVLSQELPQGVVWHVIVIDDASPCPARQEVARLPVELQVAVTIIEQPNQGPGGARNRGLDWVAAQLDSSGTRTKFDLVAFLDSDDSWFPRHLADAIEMLDLGYDQYFCDHLRFEDELTYFNMVPKILQLFEPTTPDVRMIDPDGPVYEISSDALLTAQLEAYVSQTSTIVIRAERVLRRRFDSELRNAGEDHHFWIGLAADGCKTVMSARCNVHCGRGVNVYFSALNWDTQEVISRVGNILMFHQKISRELHFSVHDRCILRDRISHYERGYSYLFMRSLLRGRVPSLQLLKRLCRASPFLSVRMPVRFLQVCANKQPHFRFW